MEICARLVKVDRVEVEVGRIFSGNCDTVVVEQLSQQFLLVQTFDLLNSLYISLGQEGVNLNKVSP